MLLYSPVSKAALSNSVYIHLFVSLHSNQIMAAELTLLCHFHWQYTMYVINQLSCAFSFTPSYDALGMFLRARKKLDVAVSQATCFFFLALQTSHMCYYTAMLVQV